MKKFIAMSLLVLSTTLFLVSCGGKSVKQVVGSYVNSTSYKEKAFFEAVFPKDPESKVDVEKISKAFDMFDTDYAMIVRYFDGREFTDDEGKSYAAYFKDIYDPSVSAYVAEAKIFVEKLKSGEDVKSYLEKLWDFDAKFIDLHNGFLDKMGIKS